jgi:ZIP family zinc transporter
VNETALAVVLLSLLSCFTASLGVGLALVLRESPRAIAAGIGFSAGLMILISVLELGPAAIAKTGVGPALTSAALGAGLLWLAHRIIPHIHLSEETGHPDRALRRSATLVALGMVLHDVPEGFARQRVRRVARARRARGAGDRAANLPEQFVIVLPAVSSEKLACSAPRSSPRSPSRWARSSGSSPWDCPRR